MLDFYFFAAIVIWLGILSLRNGLSFAAYVRREIARPLPDLTPFISVIAPCRGLEEGLQENLAVFFFKQKTAYEIIFVTDRADDPALGVIENVREESGQAVQDQLRPVVRCVKAGPA